MCGLTASRVRFQKLFSLSMSPCLEREVVNNTQAFTYLALQLRHPLQCNSVPCNYIPVLSFDAQEAGDTFSLQRGSPLHWPPQFALQPSPKMQDMVALG